MDVRAFSPLRYRPGGSGRSWHDGVCGQRASRRPSDEVRARSSRSPRRASLAVESENPGDCVRWVCHGNTCSHVLRTNPHAGERTRTSTLLRTHGPEPCLSTNSSTPACVGRIVQPHGAASRDQHRPGATARSHFATLARLPAAIVQGTRTPPSHGGNPGSNPGSGIANGPIVGIEATRGPPLRPIRSKWWSGIAAVSRAGGNAYQTGRIRTGDGSRAASGERSSLSELSTLAPDAAATKTT